MPAIHVLREVGYDGLCDLAFAGDLVVLREPDAALALADLARSHLADTLDRVTPALAHESFDAEDLGRRARRAQAALHADPASTAAFARILAGLGADLDDVYADRLHVRVRPPGAGSPAGATAAAGWHRDTWASNLPAQLNWWMPLVPGTRDNTIAFAPGRFATPVANDSVGWDLDRLRAEGPGDPAVGGVPLMPTADEAPAPAEVLPLVVEPPDLLVFSGAHLHASTVGEGPTTRASLDVRTVRASDVRAGRGAPHIDGAAPRTPSEWFRRLSDGARLEADVTPRQATRP